MGIWFISFSDRLSIFENEETDNAGNVTSIEFTAINVAWLF